MNKIAIIGAGNMGGAIALGASKAGYEVVVTNRSAGKLVHLKELASTDLLTTTTDNAEACRDATIVVLAVKPYLLANVVADIVQKIGSRKASEIKWVSLAAGIDLEELAAIIGSCKDTNNTPVAVVRVMPNIAAKLGESMTFVCGNDLAFKDGAVEAAVDLFQSIGRVSIVEEQKFNACMALASCGVAFALRYVRANVTGGIALGIPAKEARDYVVQTLRGVASLLESEPDTHIEALLDSVCTPGGVTIRGIAALDKEGFTNAIYQALNASAR